MHASESHPAPDPTTVARTMSVRCAGATNSGLRRQNNEDRIYYDIERGLYMVIDGVGGQAAGEKAAEIALTTVLATIDHGANSLDERLRTAIVDANNAIHDQARLQPELEGMGCVLTIAVLADGAGIVGHVGDSRLYQWREGKPVKVTHDHSPVGEQEDHGELSEADAMRHPMRNQVYRALGAVPRSLQDDDEFVEIQQIEFPADSAMLLCTDGLTDLVPLDEIAHIVDLHGREPEAVVQALIEAANRAGGKDNVSAIFVAGNEFTSRSHSAPDTTITRRIGPRTRKAVAEQAATPAPGRSRSALRALQRPLAVFVGGTIVGAAATAALFMTRNEAGNAAAVHTTPRQARVVRVGSGSDAVSTSIAAALSQSKAGDTILVEPGEYREPVRVSKDVTLISVRPRQAVILAVGGGSAAIEVDVPGAARLVGFTVRGGDDVPLPVGILLRGGRVEVEDVEVSGTRSAGLEIANTGDSTLRGGYFHDNHGTAILIRPGAEPRIAHNLITAAGDASAAIPAVEVFDGASPVLIGNVIRGFGANAIAGVPERAREQVRQQNLIIEGPAATPQRRPPAKERPPPSS